MNSTFKTGAIALAFLIIGYQVALFVHKASAEAIAPAPPQQQRKVESFPFDPNTVSLQDLQRLGFSEKQAASIVNYREKGGRFHRPADFAKSFVVADSVFRRLEPYIRIPQIDINAADSAAFDNLPGIGPYYAAKMVEYRDQIEGYSHPNQLLDIWNFGQERLDGLIDLITIGEYHPREYGEASSVSE
ncbi:MAG: helix-hairpin-helix domain-containing protein [Bacteroidales bacterium]|nr:helix-hairpin-helix domain-containing protein [Bacteroidales bacterium]